MSEDYKVMRFSDGTSCFIHQDEAKRMTELFSSIDYERMLQMPSKYTIRDNSFVAALVAKGKGNEYMKWVLSEWLRVDKAIRESSSVVFYERSWDEPEVAKYNLGIATKVMAELGYPDLPQNQLTYIARFVPSVGQYPNNCYTGGPGGR